MSASLLNVHAHPPVKKHGSQLASRAHCYDVYVGRKPHSRPEVAAPSDLQNDGDEPTATLIDNPLQRLFQLILRIFRHHRQLPRDALAHNRRE